MTNPTTKKAVAAVGLVVGVVLGTAAGSGCALTSSGTTARDRSRCAHLGAPVVDERHRDRMWCLRPGRPHERVLVVRK